MTPASTPTPERTVHQPLHPDIRPSLDPEYVAFHDAVLQYVPTNESLPWDPASRSKKSPMAHGGQRIVEVGRAEDRAINEDGSVQVRIFTPQGKAPAGGWPCLVWYHGGGWVMGGLNSENGFLTHICKYVGCVVVTVNYRHAPEHVYPAAADDSFAGLQWVLELENAASLAIDRDSVAVGGLSAGGGLAAVVGMRAAQAGLRLRLQMLVCPVIDNTATVESAWQPSRHAPWLTPARMQWYRRHYLGTASASAWTASPCCAPAAVLRGSPPTFLAIAGCDLLAPEAEAYARQLAAAGVAVEANVYAGATHSVLVLAGMHQTGKAVVHDACTALAAALGTAYDAAGAPVLSQA